MEKINIGLVGVGNMGKNHARLLQEINDKYHFVGVYDLDANRVLQSGFKGKIFDSIDQLFENVDAAVIATPSITHKEYALKAAAHNIHVLVEKPLSLNADDAKEICDAYSKLNKVLMVGHIERFNAVVQELEKILNNEEIIAATIERCSPMDIRIKDTDVIYDLMIHDIDILLNAIVPDQKLIEIHSFGRTAYNEINVDFVQTIFKFANCVQASIIASRTTEEKIRMVEVHCKDSLIKCDLLNKTITISRKTHYKLDTGYNPIYRQENVVEKVFVPNIEPLKAELMHFADCIEGGAVPYTNGESAVKSLKCLDEIRNQVYENRRS